MATDPTGPLAQAVLAALTTPGISYTEGGTTTTVTAHQRVPDEFQSNAYKAVYVIKSISLNQSESKDGTPIGVSIELRPHYRGRSISSLQAIAAQAYERLEQVKLTVAGFTVSECRVLSSVIPEETDEANLVHIGSQIITLTIL